jgi:hypothetical protein
MPPVAPVITTRLPATLTYPHYDLTLVQQSPTPPPDWESLGVAGALLSRYQRDQHALLEQLGVFLEGTLGRLTKVRRTLGVMGPRRTTAVSVELAGVRYSLSEVSGGGLEGSRTRIVRGVAVRTESLAVEAWLTEVADALAAELDKTSGGRAALSRLLQGGS